MDTGITIDGKTSRDLDDAISLTRAEDGQWIVNVYITNVASYVPRGHSYDEQAFERLETRYFAGGNKPMLSRVLAENKLSLREGKKRKAIKIAMKVDGLNVISTELSGVKFKSKARLSHGDVPAILSDPEHKLHEEISDLAALAKGLLEKRRERGALLIYDLTKGLITDEEGNLIKMRSREDTIGYIIVQEMMILANAEIAKWMASNGIPAIFRNHAARPSAPPREALLEQLERVAGALTMFKQQTGLMFEPATYNGHITGHFGLNLPAYAHATSPIRRYADLVNQRQIFAALNEDGLPYTAEEISELAEELTKKLFGRKERKSEAMKERANNKAEAISENASRLHSAPDKEFERVVKVVCRSGEDCPDAVIDAFKSRLKQDRVPSIALLTAIAESKLDNKSFEPLRAMTIEHLTEYPYKATSIHHMGVQSEFWDDVELDMVRSGPDHDPVFECLIGPEIYEIAGSKKLAEQRAFTSLLASRAGVESPEWEEPPKEESEQDDTPIEIGAPGDNPIGQLQEFCQKSKILPPDYEFKQSGPDHAPTFSCIAKVCGVIVESEAGGSKKNAKREAAAKLIKRIWGRPENAPAKA